VRGVAECFVVCYFHGKEGIRLSQPLAGKTIKNSEKFNVINCVTFMLVVFNSLYVLIYKRGIFVLYNSSTTFVGYEG